MWIKKRRSRSLTTYHMTGASGQPQTTTSPLKGSIRKRTTSISPPRESQQFMKTDNRQGLLHRLPERRELTHLVPAISATDNSAKEEDFRSGNGSTREIGTARAGDFMRRLFPSRYQTRRNSSETSLSLLVLQKALSRKPTRIFIPTPPS